ncbi:hypothetical protein EV180_003744 [Coemansia sp. RSA 518]|nr:hypothetical protein IW144_003279 [Coemansia sp. RSA 522]KAJ2198442.1 hypothetical protein GGH18_000999 [Coemansia sp. RSA 530]KAJ2209760.1 hypothetical protein IW143_004430 [Coemansia sp. RSA 520]KAJ2224192.1 hypothetical protein EV180_003744 [Coemansia sp. RSA 518]KAJ2288791.1 hypothetical protein IW141_004185 [Coemansia sp. RSA 355]
MAFAAGAAITLPTIGALGTIAYYANHPDDGSIKRRRSSFLSADNHREFIVDDDPSDFSTFTSSPVMSEHITRRRKSAPKILPWASNVKPDHSLLEDPHLQVWRDRYKWGRNYGMNFAHKDK